MVVMPMHFATTLQEVSDACVRRDFLEMEKCAMTSMSVRQCSMTATLMRHATTSMGHSYVRVVVASLEMDGTAWMSTNARKRFMIAITTHPATIHWDSLTVVVWKVSLEMARIAMMWTSVLRNWTIAIATQRVLTLLVTTAVHAWTDFQATVLIVQVCTAT